MGESGGFQMSKRDLLSLIGKTAGASAMYAAMTSLGHAQASSFNGPIKLSGDPKGASVLILGAGVAGMASALELSRAGYKVQLLDYNSRVGGRCWTIKGGDRFTDLGGDTQTCQFAPGNYINPGPWRIPAHHHGIIHYCNELGVPLETFQQMNYNAYIHSTTAFGGKPQRYGAIQSDYYGHVSELLAKALKRDALSDALSKEDSEILLESLRSWGALDKDMRYVKGEVSSDRRGWVKQPGGGLSAEPIPSEPLNAETVLRSGLWQAINSNLSFGHQQAIFQPVGGMFSIAQGFERAVRQFVRLDSKVTAIRQDDAGVTVDYVDTVSGAKMVAKADWLICTIPLSVLSQIPMNVSPELDAAIRAVPYTPSVKVGLEFKRRFWEQDDHIYGGISSTDLPNSVISYPSYGYGSKGPAVLLGAYASGSFAYELTTLSPAERVRRVLAWNARIHPQATEEFANGVSWAWHRSPFSLGCYGDWTDEARATHYKNLCKLDGRIMLAGEHASFLGGWLEGGITSALDAIGRLHQRVQAG